ncbi:MFS transporter [Alicyclobacillus fastidiosus]|uniref:MFS transporter n=1 Tax=Alicyclobacillus fastidiosus TaxID=392011 RepID=A0ABV5AC20_9BACL|nr:MFS transporter [Alicyclobacillus fastidiosus]WEH11472.1 MFS transporter [Alicyclobacillus fastidiosus]
MSLNVGLSPNGAVVDSRVRWRYVMPTLVLLQTLGMVDKVNVGMVMTYKPFLTYMNLTNQKALAGMLMTLFVVAYGIGMPFWGMVIDKWGARKSAILSTIAWIVMLVIGGLSTSLTWLFISRIGLGLAEATIWPLGNNLIAHWFPVKERSKASAYWVSGLSIGIALSGLLVPPMLSNFGWRSVFFILATIDLIPLCMFVFLTKDGPRYVRNISSFEISLIEQGVLEKTSEIPNYDKATTRAFYRDYRFWILTFCNVTASVLNFGINTWMPSYLTNVRHLSLSGMGYFTAISWILCPLFMVLAGRWSDHLLRRSAFITIGYIAFAVFFYFATLAESSIAVLILETIAIWGYEIAVTMTFSMLHSIVVKSHMGRSSGVLTGVSNVAAAFIPMVMGAVIGHYNSFTGAFLILSGFAVAAAALTAVLIPQRY